MLDNALKFTAADGRIDVRLGESSEFFGLEVSDTGRGISPEGLPKLFDRFFQAEQSPTPAMSR